VSNFTLTTLTLMSLRTQPCIFDKLEKAMAILALFFFVNFLSSGNEKLL